MAGLRLNPGQTACPKDCHYKRDGLLSVQSFAHKSRTRFSRKCVRGLGTKIRDLSATKMQLKPGKLLIIIGTISGIQVQRDSCG